MHRHLACVFAAALIAMGAAGCASTTSLARPSAGEIAAHVSSGEQVQVTLADGRELKLQLTRISATHLDGVTSDGKAVHLHVSSIQEFRLWNVNEGSLFGVALLGAAISLAWLF